MAENNEFSLTNASKSSENTLSDSLNIEDSISHVCIQLEKHDQPQVTFLERAKTTAEKHLTCSPSCFKKVIFDTFPVLQWLPKYKFREYIIGDIMSGLVVGIISVPQSIAYSLLASQDPIYGLYASFFPCIIYFLLGTSRHASIGIFAVLCLMIGQVVDNELQKAGYDLSANTSNIHRYSTTERLGYEMTSNLSKPLPTLMRNCDRSCYAIRIAANIAFLAGVYQVMMSILQLGFISVYLSEPLLSGFVTGSSITILTSQVKYLLGLSMPRYKGVGALVMNWVSLFKMIHHTNICDLVTSIICFLVMVPIKEMNICYKHKMKAPVPVELVVVIVATLISYYVDLQGRYGSSIAGTIPTGFQVPRPPEWNLVRSVAADTVPIAIVSFVFTISLSEIFAKKHGYIVRANQEMLAIGCCNIIPSFFYSFATSAALTKTLLKDATGCMTQVSGLVTAAVILLVLLVIAPLFHSLQNCVLAAIIIVNLRGAFRKFIDTPRMWRVSHADAIVWWVTMLASALLSTEIGLLVGICFAAVCVLVRMQRPSIIHLGRVPDTNHYADPKRYRGLLPVPNVAIFHFNSPLYYANKKYFQDAIFHKSGLNPTLKVKKNVKNKPEVTKNEDNVFSECNTRQISALVVDCSAMHFVDTPGAGVLRELQQAYGRAGVIFLLANCSQTMLDTLQKSGYFRQSEMEEGSTTSFKEPHSIHFHCVHDAVIHSLAHCAKQQKELHRRDGDIDGVTNIAMLEDLKED
uniref:sulfate transporter-like n=1 Tax=Myxine glutinosa TaxID=7769 RepID=UPI00358FE3A5